MTRRTAYLVLLPALLLLVPPASRADDEEDNPHYMLDKEGEPETDKCDFCHEDDLTLTRSKEETCLICHTADQHAGSAAHTAVKGDAMSRAVPKSKSDDWDLPLTDGGGIYCGTCHLFHDPNDASEPWLESGCKERTTPFATAVRRDVETFRDKIADAQAAHFVAEGARALRLPACDGTLCVHCHEDKR
jgi:hypothetical protein